jgi:hypothetical protein
VRRAKVEDMFQPGEDLFSAAAHMLVGACHWLGRSHQSSNSDQEAASGSFVK